MFKFKNVAICLIVLFSFVGMVSAAQANDHPEGIVTLSSGSLNVRSAPDSAPDNIIGQLSNGTIVKIVAEQGEWLQINYNNRSGYVASQYIQRISNTDTKIIVNGKQLPLPFEPPKEEQRLLVPFRVIGEALGIHVDWQASTRQVIAKDGSNQITFTIDSTRTLVNNNVQNVSPAPKIVQQTTVLPLRFFSETFGANVDWNEQTKTVTITRTQPNVPVEKKDESNNPQPTRPINADYTGTVNTETLNVRAQPNTEARSLGKLRKGDRVEVSEFHGRWAKIQYENNVAYVHSYYLDLYDGNGRVKVLGQPSVTTSGNRTTITWSKIGGTVNTVANVNGRKVEIDTQATVFDKLTQPVVGLDVIDNVATNNGYKLSLQAGQGYHVTVSDTVGELVVTVSSESKKTGGISGKKIVVDPGHGGHDPGAVANQLQEKEVVLDIGLRVKKLLEEAGATVQMTRSDDTFISLEGRANMANEANADAFVSIHANAAPGASASGVETFWNNTYAREESKMLADAIQRQLLEKLNPNDRKVKEANFYVIRHTRMASVLVEVGFLTNQAEAEKLASSPYRQKAAEAIYEGIVQYFN